jgi:hypothetical protein
LRPYDGNYPLKEAAHAEHRYPPQAPALAQAPGGRNDTAAPCAKSSTSKARGPAIRSIQPCRVDGKIRVTADDIHVTAELGFQLGMKPAIGREIERHLDSISK